MLRVLQFIKYTNIKDRSTTLWFNIKAALFVMCGGEKSEMKDL